jgi:rod shape-determining protein MreC
MANGTWRIGRGRSSARLPLLLAGLAAVLLVIAGKAHFVPFERARAAISDRTAPLLQAMNRPVVATTRWVQGIGHFFDVYSENQRLREENAVLLQWRGAALSLDQRVKQYQQLLKTVPNASYDAVNAQVIARSSQPFLETVVLNAGKRSGVRAGQAVVDARGLLGRIYVAGDHTSWVILLNDLNSRIPVRIRPGNAEGILLGNNTEEPSIEALPQELKLANGADVVTSGDGGLLPAGLPVGLVVSKGRERKVALYANPLAAEEVRILDFRSPVEEMPKPADQDLPAPDKLTPPAPTGSQPPAEAAIARTAPPPMHKRETQQTHTLTDRSAEHPVRTTVESLSSRHALPQRQPSGRPEEENDIPPPPPDDNPDNQ